MVPRLRTDGSPMRAGEGGEGRVGPRASRATVGVRGAAADARARRPASATPLSAAMPARLTRSPGLRKALLQRRDQRLAAAERLRVLVGEGGERLLDASSAATKSNAYMAVLPSVRRLHRGPDPGRRQRHVDVGDREAAGVERVEDGVDQRRRRADGAGLAAALHPERVVGAGRHVELSTTKFGTSFARGMA